jgi:hypothetical protein
MNCYYYYQPVGGYVKLSVFNTLSDIDDLKSGISDNDGDIGTLIHDYDYQTIAITILTHAFAGDSVLAERCAADFVNNTPVSADNTITLHQIADWVADWKKTH